MAFVSALMLRLLRLTLQDFRNYAVLDWRPAGRIVVLTGPNGSGKTNLLEALSLLVPGRGLRGARTVDLPRRGMDGVAPGWGIAARFEAGGVPLEIGTGVPAGAPQDRRVFRLDGAAPRSQAELGSRLAMVWLTPQMDGLFQEPASGRRRFLDRLVYALEPAHAREIAAHETGQSQRMRLLAAGGTDPAWLAGLEDSIARHAVAATANRAGLVRRLNAALEDGAAAGFPAARMRLACPIAGQLAASSALATEDWLRRHMVQSRAADAAAGSARHGAQRADMGLEDAATGRDAALSSTGQQKALLIGVLLGHAALIAGLRGQPPVLLLDEPMVHLDAARRAALCAAVAGLRAQILLTGTDEEAFAPLRHDGSFVHAQDGMLLT